MESNRKIAILIFLFLCSIYAFAQNERDSISKEAYLFKLDYNVPESPAFSVLDANPTLVMRGNAAPELVIHLASNFISNNNVDPGLAVDFNPFFVFGGRLQSINEYREKPYKRILTNTQLSFATISSKDFPDDLLISGGLRVTLFDTKDMLFDKQLSNDIDMALSNNIPLPMPGVSTDKVVNNPSLTDAYKNAKERYTNAKGGSVSIGYALALRAINNSFKTDSIVNYRQQAWVVGQYDFGKSKMSINSMLMFRQENGSSNDENGIISGIALRHYGKKIIITAEIIYDGLRDEIGFGGYIEAYVLPNISIYASLGKDNSEFSSSNDYAFKPGIKWNLSESKK